VQDLDLDNRQAPIRSQRRRDPMGVLGHRHRPPAPALAAPARRPLIVRADRCSCPNAIRPGPPASAPPHLPAHRPGPPRL
jgi:hypothetical protein